MGVTEGHDRPVPTHPDASRLLAAIESMHPDPFRTVDRDTLVRQAARIGALDPTNRSPVAAELMRMISLLGPRNGHTAIHPRGPHPSPLSAYPVRLYEFADGIFVTGAERADLVGTRLVAIDGTGIDDVVGAVTPLVAYDNEWTVRERRPAFLVCASVLHGLGLVREPGRALFRFRTRGSTDLEVRLEATMAAEPWRHPPVGRGSEPARPAHLRRRHERHWAEVTADGRAVHVGYNVTRGDVTDLAREVEALAAVTGVGAVVLDLRHNGGGDNRTDRPVLEALERLGAQKPLAVLISRTTFSAAMQLVVDLEQRTPALFVGEPTGGSPNQYGDAALVELPDTALNAFVATISWTTAGDSDERLTKEPDVPVPVEAGPFFSGADPTLDAALEAAL